MSLTGNPIDPSQLPEAPRPRLSPLRVLVALLALLAAAAGGYFGVQHVATSQAARAEAAVRKQPWFAPYVDATLTPAVAFQDKAANPADDVVLGFVVAKSATGCEPTWGTYATLAGAATTLDLDRRLAQLRGRGGDVMVSFGGAANTELALACDTPETLASAYAAVVDRYDLTALDLDIEGPALSDSAANLRRAVAIKALQDRARARKQRLAVWLTLPVTPDGLDAAGLAVVRTMLAQRVDLAGVNVMAMDYGVPSAARNMRRAVISSATATHRQLQALYPSASRRPGARALWSRLGITVMLGQNDVDAERLSVADARAVATFADARGVGRVSMWSLNRDASCGPALPVVGTHSNFCSGVEQKARAFTKAFLRLRGAGLKTSAAASVADQLPEPTTTMADDPARSPYPIWQPETGYREGYKVVWHRAVYIAKWYSQGQTPDAVNVAGDASPWRLIGPVLRTDRAPALPRVPAGTYPDWSPSKVYRAGARVLRHRLPYRASWYTQGDVPGGTGRGDAPSPWKPLYTIPGEPAVAP
jgi:chitinase